MEATPWRIHGEIIDTCNCEAICPCTLGAPPTEGKCLGNVLWSIDEGRYGSADLTGLAVVLALYAPGPKFDDGNWRVAMYGDERATSEQREPSRRSSWVGPVGSLMSGVSSLLRSSV